MLAMMGLVQCSLNNNVWCPTRRGNYYEQDRTRPVDGVRAYKQTATVLQEFSSAILNGMIPRNTKGDSTIAEVKNTEETLVEEKEEKTTAVVKDKKTTREAKEETRKYPQMNFGNASNFTINFNFNTN